MNSAAAVPLTLQQLMTIQRSSTTCVWVNALLPAYTYNGAKVWSVTHDTVIPYHDTQQLAYVGLSDSNETNQLLGRLVFDYSIDFFEPRPARLLPSASLLLTLRDPRRTEAEKKSLVAAMESALDEHSKNTEAAGLPPTSDRDTEDNVSPPVPLGAAATSAARPVSGSLSIPSLRR